MAQIEVTTFDQSLDPNDDHDERGRVASWLATLAEAHFVHLVIARAEHKLARTESIHSLIDTLFHISNALAGQSHLYPMQLSIRDHLAVFNCSGTNRNATGRMVSLGRLRKQCGLYCVRDIAVGLGLYSGVL